MEKTLKDKAIAKEESKIKELFKDLPKENKKLCEGLIQNTAFMTITLRELQEDIKENGAVITTTGGNGFEVVKDNPAIKTYNTMIARYTAAIKQLAEMLPDSETAAGKEILDFLNSN